MLREQTPWPSILTFVGDTFEVVVPDAHGQAFQSPTAIEQQSDPAVCEVSYSTINGGSVEARFVAVRSGATEMVSGPIRASESSRQTFGYVSVDPRSADQ